jgi:hydrogenase maturation protease
LSLTPSAVAPTLILSWGNPSRGDDALGPVLHERLSQSWLAGVELITDFQLQIEHSLDLLQRERVIFVDASQTTAAPFIYQAILAERDDSYSSHAMSPQALLGVFEQVQQQPAPSAFLLSIRGYEFGLGLPLSPQANNNLQQACDYLFELLSRS